MSRTFTLAEANRLIPTLDALLTRAREGALRAGGYESEMQDLSQRIFLSGGMHVDVPAAAKRRAERDKAVEEVKSTIAEIDDLGPSVDNLSEGSLVIPTTLEGRTVLLLWSLGEEQITHWREQDEADDVRRDLDSRFARNDRPN